MRLRGVIVVCGALLAGMSGCSGGDDGSEGSAAEASAASTETSAAADEPVAATTVAVDEPAEEARDVLGRTEVPASDGSFEETW
jgi:hypothetical protein